jgi:hypothetical protein
VIHITVEGGDIRGLSVEDLLQMFFIGSKDIFSHDTFQTGLAVLSLS